ncbi:bifunctional adenosylcobinamide kinase/adenosylcobinamide-phosphate guanylyltransferase [Streptomyces sp. 4N509B]|uniref:bifunctional adenosylcobinamide kinase/adenosylcobinamide-phosphate guanylyltransferase n=1 Tax=Streptomyces sp. 4N509B TaxID=3457413 RepID=UPI003FD03926
MDVTLLGTGGRLGLPRPGCPCAACARALGPDARTPTAVLVDGALLLDPTPGTTLSAARAGRSVRGVRLVLTSRPHDGPAPHDGPPAAPPEPLPTPTRVPEGRELTSPTGHRVRAVAVDRPGTGHAVTGPRGERLLHLPPGAAPASVPGPAARPFDAVLMDVVGRPDALAALRATGAVAPTTEVLAVHLDHDAPPGAELHRRLAAAGARAEPDGATVAVGGHRAAPGPPRRTLLLGGARSGKSEEAERRLATFPDVVYVATAGPGPGAGTGAGADPEWEERIAAHRARRPAGWLTTETRELVPLLARDDGPPLLVDCLTLWLTHAMDAAGCFEGDHGAPDASARLRERTGALVAAVRATRRTVVIVSNEVGSGVVPATPAGRRFRDELGRLNAEVAAECEQVLLFVAGAAVPLRGRPRRDGGPRGGGRDCRGRDRGRAVRSCP